MQAVAMYRLRDTLNLCLSVPCGIQARVKRRHVVYVANLRSRSVAPGQRGRYCVAICLLACPGSSKLWFILGNKTLTTTTGEFCKYIRRMTKPAANYISADVIDGQWTGRRQLIRADSEVSWVG